MGPIVAVVLVALAAGYGFLRLVAAVRTEPRDIHPFLVSRAGEHSPLVVAHQGGELLRPSNTMAAFEHAVDLGADVLDTDLHRTADGALVLLHDETVDRTSDGTGAVRDLSLAELRELDLGWSFAPLDDPDARPYRGSGVRIVTVDELFEAFADDARVRFGIEIKQTVPEAADELCATIRRFRLEDRVLVSSFGQPNMDAFRAACPAVATSATEEEVRRFYLLHRLGLAGLASPAFDVLQVPEYSGGFHILTDGFLDAARDWGIPVIPWTIDEPDDLARVVGMGVSGINTNRPDLLVGLVQGG